jgi:hypothetical protein
VACSVVGLAFTLLGREQSDGSDRGARPCLPLGREDGGVSTLGQAAVAARPGSSRRSGDAHRGKERGGGGSHRLAQRRRGTVVGSGPRDGATQS